MLTIGGNSNASESIKRLEVSADLITSAMRPADLKIAFAAGYLFSLNGDLLRLLLVFHLVASMMRLFCVIAN